MQAHELFDKVFQKAMAMNVISFFTRNKQNKKKKTSNLLETLPLCLNYIIFQTYLYNLFTYADWRHSKSAFAVIEVNLSCCFKGSGNYEAWGKTQPPQSGEHEFEFYLSALEIRLQAIYWDISTLFTTKWKYYYQTHRIVIKIKWNSLI